MRPTILIIDDESRMRRSLTMLLSDLMLDFLEAENGEEALRVWEHDNPDVVITDLKMPKLSGMDLLKEIKRRDPDVPVIVITAYGTIENAVEAMKEGAFDYITKPFDEKKILPCVDKALKMRRLISEVRYLRKEIEGRYNFENIVGQSQAICRVLEMAGQVAKSDTTVLITGESGTGKELVSRAIHFNSNRASAPFLAVNCAAIPPSLLEAELFGFEKGAFTGAVRQKKGRFELASGGTIFLDEISDMPLDIQAGLLRVIEEQEFERLGGTRTIKVNVRVIAATNKDLASLVAKGLFREDLYHRINVFPIHLPPLRERREDIPLLVRHFIKEIGNSLGKKPVRLTESALNALMEPTWPGNVRELRNIIERAMILCKGSAIARNHLIFNEPVSARRMDRIDLEELCSMALDQTDFSLEQLEERLLKLAMERAGYNVSGAARLLGMTRATLRYRLEKFGLTPQSSTFRPGRFSRPG